MEDLKDNVENSADWEADSAIDDEKNEKIVFTPPYSYDLDIYTESTSVQELIAKFMRKELQIPPFQRPYVWDTESKGSNRHKPSLFIDSVLLGLPIPSIVVYKKAVGTDESAIIVDGQQRIKSLVYFKHSQESQLLLFDKGFVLKGDDVDSRWVGKDHQTILQELGDIFIDKSFNERKIPVVHIRQVKPTQDDRPTSIYKIFDRLNSGGMELHAHEIRMALSFQNLETENIFQLLKSIEENFAEFWIRILPKSYQEPKHYGKKMEIFYRILIASFFYEHYKRTFRQFLDEYAKKKEEDYGKPLAEIKIAFEASITSLREYYNNNSTLFKPNNRFNLRLFEAISMGLFKRELLKQPPLSISKFKELYDAFQEKNYHNPNITDNEGRYKQRYKMAAGLFTGKINPNNLESPDAE